MLGRRALLLGLTQGHSLILIGVHIKRMATKKPVKKKQAKKAPALNPKYKHKQKLIFENSGLTDNAIKFFRDTLPNNEWAYKKGVGYFYSEEGLLMIQNRINVDLNVKRDWVKVLRPSKGIRGIICETIEGKIREVVVTCSDNSKFRIGRYIPVRGMIGDTAILEGRNPVSIHKW